MDQYIKNKIRRTKPRFLEAVPAEGGDAVRIDTRATSTQAVHGTIDSVDWEVLRALDDHENVVWILNREDLESDESETEYVRADSNPQVGSPESWLSILIRAQESATRAQNEAMTVLVDALQASHARSQELLDRAHETILAQREQIDRLLEERGPAGIDVEKLVEQLAPVIAPLLMQSGGGGK